MLTNRSFLKSENFVLKSLPVIKHRIFLLPYFGFRHLAKQNKDNAVRCIVA